MILHSLSRGQKANKVKDQLKELFDVYYNLCRGFKIQDGESRIPGSPTCQIFLELGRGPKIKNRHIPEYIPVRHVLNRGVRMILFV